MITQSRIYLGYDSAGQHVAAAAGVPLVSIFRGFASDRMFARWRPVGRAPAEVVKVADKNSEAVLAAVLPRVDRLLRLR